MDRYITELLQEDLARIHADITWASVELENAYSRIAHLEERIRELNDERKSVEGALTQ